MQVPKEKPSDHDFHLLGVTPQTPPDQVKKAYRQLVRRWHPDHFQQHSPQAQRQAEDKLKEINGAYHRIVDGWSEHKSSASRPQSAHQSRPRSTQSKPTEHSQKKADPHSNHTSRSHVDRMHGKQPLSPSIQRRIRYGLLGLLFLLALTVINFVPFKPRPVSPPSPRENGPEVALQLNTQNTTPPPNANRAHPPEAPDAQVPTSEPNQLPAGITPPSEPTPERGHFGLGATEAEVLRIQGPPNKTRGQTWIYNLSDLQFKDGRVFRYNNFDGSLKIRLKPSEKYTEIPPFFSLGSTKDEVLAVQGTPTRIINQTWYYGFSEVRFREARVVAFDNFFGNLKIRMLPSFIDDIAANRQSFSIGASTNEVLAVQGTPTSVQGSMWFYGLSNILFRNGRVEYVFDTTGNLHFESPEG